MTLYTWKTQFSENYPDEFKENGTIDKEKAIEAFQLFPWDKEVDDYSRRQDNATVPKIIYTADDKRELIVSTTSNNGFEIEYTNFGSNNFSDFYLSNNFEKKNFAPEEIVEFFFDGTLEQYIRLKKIPETKAPEPKARATPRYLTFLFKPSLSPLLTFNFFLWLAIISGYGYFFFTEAKLPLWPLVLFAAIWSVPLVVHLSYYVKNAGAKILVDVSNHELTYSKGSTEIKFTRNDIFRCQVTYTKNTKHSLCHNYSYVWFILNDRKYVVITHFVGDPTEIAEALNCKFETRFSGPFLPVF